MLFNLALLAMASVNPSTAPAVQQNRTTDGPGVEVWTNHDDVFQRGDRVRVYFRASDDGYITVFRIDTDGRVRVLYPTEPWQDNYARANQQYEVRSYGDRYAFSIDDYPGQGYVFAVASRDPFSYGSLVRGDHWDYRQIAEGGRVTGDPYVALTDLVDRIVPANYSEYSYDVQQYYVEQHYQYPRFLCYDCHSYASYPYWNPYSYSCFRFRIVIYDDFYYYPRRDYRGQRVIYRSAPRLAPRYVFKDRGQSEPYVTTVRERPVDQTGRRVVDPGVTSRDLGGSGRVPVPVGNTGSGRRPSTSSDGIGASGQAGRRAVDPVQNTGPRPGELGNRRPVEANPNEQPVRRPGESGTVEQGADGRRVNPNDRPGRADPETASQPTDNRRPAIIPPAPSGEDNDRPQPRLERRDPRREPDSRPDVRNDQPPAREPERQPERPRVERQPDRPRVERQPEPRVERQPDRPRVERQPEPRVERQPDRPRVERQPEPRAQPRQEPRAEPKQEPRRAEPRSEPKRAPEEKPKDSESRRRS